MSERTLVSIRWREVPKLDSERDLGRFVARIVSEGPPGFVIKSPTVKEGCRIAERVIGYMNDHGGWQQRISDFTGAEPLGWHADFGPGPDECIDVYAAKQGAGMARLVVPKPALWKEINTGRHLPDWLQDHLEAGSVDSTLLEPTGYQVALSTGDVFVFRVGGLNPTFHDFKDTISPRLAHVRVGQVAADQLIAAGR